jgi:hypothetical protein
LQNVYVENSVFSNNRESGYYASVTDGELHITDSDASNNLQYGIYVSNYGASLQIRGCTINNNTNYAIYCYTRTQDKYFELSNSTVSYNKNYAVYLNAYTTSTRRRYRLSMDLVRSHVLLQRLYTRIIGNTFAYNKDTVLRFTRVVSPDKFTIEDNLFEYNTCPTTANNCETAVHFVDFSTTNAPSVSFRNNVLRHNIGRHVIYWSGDYPGNERVFAGATISQYLHP